MRDHGMGGRDQDGATELTAAEAALAGRVATVLRADAAAPRDFDVTVMRAIAAEGSVAARPPLVAEQGRAWWTRKRAVALSPIGGLALAAGFAGIVALGTLAAVRDAAPVEASSAAAGAATRTDTVHLVRFVLVQPGAQQVSLVGDFNGWSREAMPLQAADGVTWTLSVPLAPGRYEYAFVVDGQRWVADPSARAVRDEFGGESSVLRLAGNGDRVM